MLTPKAVLLSVATTAFALAMLIALGQGGQVFRPRVLPVVNTNYLPQAPQPKRCKVIKVYDGDTLACDFNHNGKLETSTERVRLLIPIIFTNSV